MPLIPGSSREAISQNIHELSHSETKRPHDQIVAIALSNARRHPSKGKSIGLAKSKKIGVKKGY